MEYRLDMTNMFTIHDAFRRDLMEISRVAALADRGGREHLQSQLGWELFKKFLLVHHQTEDDVMWPVLRTHLKDDPHRAVVDALQAEHSAIEPCFTAIDSAPGYQGEPGSPLVDYVGELASKLTAHLAHEESDGLALIDEFLTPEEWQTFAREHGRRLVNDASTYVPWLLDEARPDAIERFLSTIPPPLAVAYREQWAPAYAALDLWDARIPPAPTNTQGA
jgi:Hemerythrin HHE cation binding domain